MKGTLSHSLSIGLALLFLAVSSLAVPPQARNLKPAPAAPLRRGSRPSPTPTALKTAEVSGVGAACTPDPSPDAAHFIIGYGSLIQSASKERTLKGTGESIPVQVQGFRREWNLKGDGLGPDTTYLGVVPDPESSFNGVVFQLRVNSNSNSKSDNSSIVEAIRQYDEREKFYCRRKVDIKNIRVLGGQRIRADVDSPVKGQGQEPVQVNFNLKGSESQSQLEYNAPAASGNEPQVGAARPQKKNEYWIYVNKPEFIDRPTKEYPIVQSYVDVFVSGCLELQEKFKLKDFAKSCVDSTKGWSEHWLNDRIFPRRPFVFQPMAGKIDAVLFSQLPMEFDKIQIEG